MNNWPICVICLERLYNPAVSKGGCNLCLNKTPEHTVLVSDMVAKFISEQKLALENDSHNRRLHCVGPLSPLDKKRKKLPSEDFRIKKPTTGRSGIILVGGVLVLPIRTYPVFNKVKDFLLGVRVKRKRSERKNDYSIEYVETCGAENFENFKLKLREVCKKHGVVFI